MNVVSLIAAGAFAGLVPVTGYVALTLAARGAARPALDLELAVLSTLTGVAAATPVALGLAYAGVFGPVAAATALGGLLALALAVAAWRGRRVVVPSLRMPTRAEICALALAAAAMAWYGTHRSQEISSIRDPGVYVAKALELARTGDFGWTDPLPAAHGPFFAKQFWQDESIKYEFRPRFLRASGHYMQDEATGAVMPQFLHTWDVWPALAAAAAGPQGLMLAPGVFSCLAALALFVAGRRMGGSGAAGLAAQAVFLANPLQAWFARTPGNELFTQAMLWGAVALWARAEADRASESGGAGAGMGSRWPTPRRAQAAGMALLATAALGKIAAWTAVPVFAAYAGWRSSDPDPKRRGALGGAAVAAGLTALIFVVWLHARMASGFYLWGSWLVGGGRRAGVPWAMAPAIMAAGVAAAYCGGALAGPVARWAWSRWRGQASGVSWAGPARAGATLALLAVAGVSAAQHLAIWRGLGATAAAGAVGGVAPDVWNQSTTLAEFERNLSMPVWLPALGLAWAVRRRAPGAALAGWLALAASPLLVERMLENVQPWGARRWLPVLLPAAALGVAAGWGAVRAWAAMRGPYGRWITVAATGLLGAAVVAGPARMPALFAVRQDFGAMPSIDALAARLRPDDLVLMHPTQTLARFVPYLKARFDIDAYPIPWDAAGWEGRMPVARRVANAPVAPGAPRRRVVYVTDVAWPDTPAVAQGGVYRESLPLDMTSLPDRERIAATATTNTHVMVHLYEIRVREAPRGWWPGLSAPVESPPPPQAPPLDMPMDAAAEPRIGNFSDPVGTTPDLGYRWTFGRSWIHLGEWLEPATTGSVTVSLAMNSGRPGAPPVIADVYLDLGHPERQRRVVSVPVKAGWAETTFTLRRADIRPDSILEIGSLRPAVAGKGIETLVGVLVRRVRVEEAP